jgi:hypothetical protein
MFKNAQDANLLWAEVSSAEEIRDDRLSLRSTRLARLAGPYAFGRQSAEYEPENRIYEFLSYTLPRASFNNPRVRIRSRRQGVADLVAKAMQSGMNRLIVDLDIRRVLRRNCLDYLMDFGPMLITPQPKPGMMYSGRPVWWPQLYPLDPTVFFMDPLADVLEAARFAGHVYLRDKSELLEAAKNDEEDWNLSEVKALAEESGIDKVHPDRYSAPARGEVALYEVWVPELHADLDVDPDDGYSGTLYTLGCAKGQDYEQPYMLRKPRPYYGPRWGPYRVASFMTVQDLPYGLSPTTAAEAQLRDLAATSRAMLANARAHKTLTTMPANDPVAIAAAQAEGRYVVPLKGDPDVIKTIELGGVTQQQLMHFQMKAQTLDRVLGMADVQRGLVSGAGTASEVLTAQAASDIRTADIVQVFQDHVHDCLKTASWYTFHDDRFLISLTEQDMPIPLPKPMFRGGDNAEQGITYDDLELELEAWSMAHESPQARQERVGRTVEIVSWLAETIPAAPWMPWHQIIPELVEDAGIKEAMEGMDIKAAVEWAMAMQGFEGQSQNPPKATSGRQSQGKPINVRMKPPESGAVPGGKSLPKRTQAGGYSVPKPAQNGAQGGSR